VRLNFVFSQTQSQTLRTKDVVDFGLKFCGTVVNVAQISVRDLTPGLHILTELSLHWDVYPNNTTSHVRHATFHLYTVGHIKTRILQKATKNTIFHSPYCTDKT
jgi:hypothetical protein